MKMKWSTVRWLAWMLVSVSINPQSLPLSKGFEACAICKSCLGFLTCKTFNIPFFILKIFSGLYEQTAPGQQRWRDDVCRYNQDVVAQRHVHRVTQRSQKERESLKTMQGFRV